MLGPLLRILKKKPTGTRRRRRRDNWELIGRKVHSDERLEKVPPWVMKEIARIYRGATSSLGEEIHYLKGRTYRYKLVFGGQGGPMLGVYRRRRRKNG